MIKRIGLLLVAALMAVMIMAASAMPAMAAPITCPSNQEPVKTASGWECQNPSGNLSGAAKTKNPNDRR